MTPIYYDGTTAKVADITDEWYSYKNSLWANAVLIKSEKRDSYKEIDKVVSEDDILAYFVWIPRYEYTIKGTYGVNGTSPHNYLTHPAFTLGDKELSGIWVGKFETTYALNGGNATNTIIEDPTIKPEIMALRNQKVSTQYLTSLISKIMD